MPTIKERLKHFENHQKEAGDVYGAEVLHRARNRIIDLETQLNVQDAGKLKNRIAELESALIDLRQEAIIARLSLSSLKYNLAKKGINIVTGDIARLDNVIAEAKAVLETNAGFEVQIEK